MFACFTMANCGGFFICVGKSARERVVLALTLPWANAQHQLPPQIESLIVTFKREKPHWGARKIRELLLRRLDQDLRIPAKSTIHAVLHRHGLVKGIRRARHRATGTALSEGIAPNDLWCADFKGEFKLGNGRYCYPLTVTDHASRYLLMCGALESTP